MSNPGNVDLYADLGLTREASRAEITGAYRALLRRNHPDTRTHQNHLGPSAAPSHSAPSNSAPAKTGVSMSGLASSPVETLNRALAAYAVLADTDRRASYDDRWRNQRSGSEERTPPAAAHPTHPARPVVVSFWPFGAAQVGSPLGDPPPIRVGPVRWHHVSPTARRRP